MAQRLHASVVGVSLPTASSAPELVALRGALPSAITLVAGGAFAGPNRGIVRLQQLADLPDALDRVLQRAGRGHSVLAKSAARER